MCSAAERRPDVADDPEKREHVLRLNVLVPEFLGTLTRKKGILLIYISSGKQSLDNWDIIWTWVTVDYVFDGRNPPYYPDSKPKYQPLWLDLTCSPLNFYGETKLNGERAALAANPDSAISLRVPVLYVPLGYLPSDIHRYGEGENEESAVNTLLDGALVSSSPCNESQLTPEQISKTKNRNGQRSNPISYRYSPPHHPSANKD
jgi:hypothetical protein